MSIRIMTRAWDTVCESHTSKLVLLKLADNANDQGFCWPSIATVARQCDMSQQGVRDQIHKLEGLGLLSVKRTTGGKSNRYRLFRTPHGVEGSIHDATPNGVDHTPHAVEGQPPTRLRVTPHAVGSNRQEPSVQPSNNLLPEESFVVMRQLLADAFYRPIDSPWSYTEEWTLAELLRERPKIEPEFRMILDWRSKLEPAKRKYFPGSIQSLLCNWSKTLDRA